jgi:hypothetical protein
MRKLLNPWTKISIQSHFQICFAASNHSDLKILRIMLSRSSLSAVGVTAQDTFYFAQPILFIAAILRLLLLSARNSTRSTSKVSKAYCKAKFAMLV